MRSLMIGFGLWLLISSQTLAGIIFDNTNNFDSPLAAGDVLDGTGRGITFTVGAGGLIVDQVTFGINIVTENTVALTLSLYSGSQATGTALETGSWTGSLSNSGLFSFNIFGGWALQANTQYTLALSGGGAATPSIGTSTLASSQWVSNGLTFDRFTAGTGDAGKNYFMQITAVPEPSSFLSVSLALMGLGFVRRRVERQR